MEWGDRYLVWRLRRGDADACRELIRRHHHVVFGHLRRLGADRALAEDLTQETYAKAWCKIEGLRQATLLLPGADDLLRPRDDVPGHAQGLLVVP